MDLRLFFSNYDGFKLSTGDKLFFIDNRDETFVFISRADGLAEEGIYHLSTGKLIAEKSQYDDATVVCSENSEVYYAGERFLKIRKGDKVGAYSMKGELMLLMDFKDIIWYANGMCIVQGKDDLYGIYSDKGKLILPIIYKKIKKDYGGFYVAKSKDVTSVVSKNGIVLIKDSTEKISLYREFAVLQEKDSFTVYSHEGKLCQCNGQYRHSSNGFFEVIDENKRGIIYKNGSVVVPMDYYVKIRKSGDSFIAETSDGVHKVFFI